MDGCLLRHPHPSAGSTNAIASCLRPAISRRGARMLRILEQGSLHTAMVRPHGVHKSLNVDTCSGACAKILQLTDQRSLALACLGKLSWGQNTWDRESPSSSEARRNPHSNIAAPCLGRFSVILICCFERFLRAYLFCSRSCIARSFHKAFANRMTQTENLF